MPDRPLATMPVHKAAWSRSLTLQQGHFKNATAVRLLGMLQAPMQSKRQKCRHRPATLCLLFGGVRSLRTVLLSLRGDDSPKFQTIAFIKSQPNISLPPSCYWFRGGPGWLFYISFPSLSLVSRLQITCFRSEGRVAKPRLKSPVTPSVRITDLANSRLKRAGEEYILEVLWCKCVRLLRLCAMCVCVTLLPILRGLGWRCSHLQCSVCT